MGAMGLDTTVLAAGSQVREYADRHSPGHLLHRDPASLMARCCP